MRSKSAAKHSETPKKVQANCKQQVNSTMMTSIKMLHTMNYEDSSLRAYRNKLIPDQSLINENKNPQLQIKSLQLYILQGLSKKIQKVYTYNQNKKLLFQMKQKSLYEIQLKILISYNLLMGLTIQNSIYKGPIKLKKQVYKQGTFAPSTQLQETCIKISTPGGIMGRGSFVGQAQIKDKFGKIFKTIKYNISII